jgi:hypothetical protein
MKTREIQADTVLARVVAPEDLCADDFVAVLNEVIEFPSYLWHCDSFVLPPQEPVRVQRQAPDNGLPLRIVDVCLPFVFVKRPSGQHETLDLRRCQFVKLNRGYAKRVWKALARANSKRTDSVCPLCT